MKSKNIFKIAMIFMVALTWGFMNTACSDWDDHYDAGSSSAGSSASSLWQNISSDPNLSQFAALLQRTGYDKVLDASQTYTVWAPLNGTFDYEGLSQESDDKLIKEFIQNHIARNNYPASGEIDETVFMLNEKMLKFVGNSEYVFGGTSLERANYMPSSNGVVHALTEAVPFRYNIYESLFPDDFEIDSISEFYHSYDQKVLNEYRSVQGPPVDGKITYLDEVYDETNLLYSLYRAYINHEDSNYTMLVPTNEAWIKAKDKLAGYFKYIDKFQFAENTSTDSKVGKLTPITINSEYLRDSMINYNLMNNLFFNNNLYDNKKLNDFNPSSALVVDSLVSTSFSVLYPEDAAALFEQSTRVDKSNGAMYITDSLRMRPWIQWCPEIKVEAESGFYLANSYNCDLRYSGTVSSATMNSNLEGRISSNRFIYTDPATPTSRPQVDYYIPNVRSTTYNIYVVTVPANIFNPNETKLLPTRFQVYIGSNNANTGDRTRSSIGTVESNGTRIDTVYVGKYTFPIAYVGTGYFPYIQVCVRSADANHDNTMRLDCIMLVPEELDKYKKEHPDYEYYQGGAVFYY